MGLYRKRRQPKPEGEFPATTLQSKSLRVFDVAHVAKVTLKGKVEARVHKRHKHMILAELDV